MADASGLKRCICYPEQSNIARLPAGRFLFFLPLSAEWKDRKNVLPDSLYKSLQYRNIRYHEIPACGKNPPESALRIGDILSRKKYRADTRFSFAMYDRISSRKSVRFSCGIPCVLYNVSKSTLAGLRLSRVIFDSK